MRFWCWLVGFVAAGSLIAMTPHRGPAPHANPPAIHEVILELPGTADLPYRALHVLMESDEPASRIRAVPFVTLDARWERPLIEWWYNASDAPIADPQFAITGASAWTDAGGTGFRFVYKGTTPTKSNCQDPISEWKPDRVSTVAWGPLPARVLGLTCVGGRTKLADGRIQIEEADIIFSTNAGMTQSETATIIATHEFGHALGLDHAEPGKCPGAIMCAELGPGTPSKPAADDLDGVAQLYSIFRNRRTLPAVTRD